MPRKESSTRTKGSGASGGSARQTLREAQREFTRRLLMEVAAEVFEQDGYANTTIDDIVKAANATRATFYQYFNSKRDIATALLDEMSAKGSAMFDAFASVAPLTRESVRDWLGQVAQFYAEFRTVMDATRNAAAQDPELARRIAATQAAFIEQVFAPRLVPDQRHSARVRAALLEAQRSAIMQWWIIDGWDLDGEKILEALTDSWAEALGIESPKRTRR
jgi:AcrR family transcriptional regulator